MVGDAEYKRFTVETTGDVTVTLDTTTPVNPTSIDFIVTGTGTFQSIFLFTVTSGRVAHPPMRVNPSIIPTWSIIRARLGELRIYY